MALLTTLPALVSPFSFCSYIIFLENNFEAEVALRLSTDFSLFRRGGNDKQGEEGYKRT